MDWTQAHQMYHAVWQWSVSSMNFTTIEQSISGQLVHSCERCDGGGSDDLEYCHWVATIDSRYCILVD